MRCGADSLIRRGLALSVFGSRMVSTPSVSCAEIASESVAVGEPELALERAVRPA
jgi:hypothetical protein